MLHLLALLASANITAPIAINPASWITARDYPYARTAQEEGITRFQLIISNEGKIVQCQVINSSGFQDLDNLTCALMAERGHFRPALDQNGKPIWSVFRNQIVWQAPGHSLPNQPWEADLTLQVNRLPPKVSDPTTFRLHLVVAGDGHVEACDANVGKHAIALGKIACQQTEDSWTPHLVRGADGVAQRSLQSVNVEFTTAGNK